mmetsp:Transcript_39433/g.95355  ORF Transcript_39433/g.95355 Transcript_39433/m.95355 type:complete len:348 (-) Transcript_39433:59-1102(-)
MSVGIFTEQVDDTREDGFEDQGRDSFPTIENDSFESEDDADDAQDAGDVEEEEQNEEELEHIDTSSRLSLTKHPFGSNSHTTPAPSGTIPAFGVPTQQEQNVAIVDRVEPDPNGVQGAFSCPDIVSLRPRVKEPDGTMRFLPRRGVETELDMKDEWKAQLQEAVTELADEEGISKDDIFTTSSRGVLTFRALYDIPDNPAEHKAIRDKLDALKGYLKKTAFWETARKRIVGIRKNMDPKDNTVLPPAIANTEISGLDQALDKLAKDFIIGIMDGNDFLEFKQKGANAVKNWWKNEGKATKEHFMCRYHTHHVESLATMIYDHKDEWCVDHNTASLKHAMDKKGYAWL